MNKKDYQFQLLENSKMDKKYRLYPSIFYEFSSD